MGQLESDASRRKPSTVVLPLAVRDPSQSNAAHGHATPRSRFDRNTFAKDRMRANPAVDATTVVANLKSVTLNGLDEVDVLAATHAAHNNVADTQGAGVNWRYRTQLSRFNAPRHGVTPGTKRNRFALLQPGNVSCSPAHDYWRMRAKLPNGINLRNREVRRGVCTAVKAAAAMHGAVRCDEWLSSAVFEGRIDTIDAVEIDTNPECHHGFVAEKDGEAMRH